MNDKVVNDKGGRLDQFQEARHHRAEILFGAAAFASAVFLASQLSTQLTWKAGKAFVNQPGFMPTIAIAGMLAFGALELLFAWRRNASGRGDSITGEVVYWTRSLEYAVWFMVYVFIVPWLGYLPASLIFCLALTIRLGYRQARILTAALLVGLATVLIFKSFLAVKIPGGAVYDYFPDAVRNFLILYL